LVVYILIVGLIFWLLNYLVDAIPLPEPFNKVAKVVLLVAAVLIVIILLLQALGLVHGGILKLAH